MLDSPAARKRIMSNSVIVLAAALAGLAFGSAYAAQPNAPRTVPFAIDPMQAAGTPPTIAFIYSPANYGIELNKGIAAITSPAIGIFCLTPRLVLKATSLPVVTVDWGGSTGNSLAAFVSHYASSCTNSQIEVHTYNFAGAPTDNVAFQVIVQ
jgi:hypothetical protein